MRRTAFTLVELMISIALMLLLMLGINAVFGMVGKATSAGQALSDNNRNAQAIQATFYRDFSGAVVSDAPCILLRSEITPAFRNRQDWQSAVDQSNPLRDIDHNSIAPNGGSLTYSTTDYNNRVHRTDIFSFFARDFFHRQTGNTGYYVADQSSNEAWIWYGHLKFGDNSQQFSGGAINSDQNPGGGTLAINPNNFFATQWAIGRVAILMVQPNGAGSINVAASGGDQRYYTKTGTAASNLAPFQSISKDDKGQFALPDARYDLAGTTIDGFRSAVKSFLAAAPQPGAQWWVTPFGGDWWNRLMLDPTGFDARFHASSFLSRPVDSDQMSKLAPVFLPGCTQFIVEYAGDFISQDNVATSGTYGDATGAYFKAVDGKFNQSGVDGEIDYIVLNRGTASQSKQIRWYGMPRDTAAWLPQPKISRFAEADGVIDGQSGTKKNNDMPDVIPLRDVIQSIPGYQTVGSAPFEKLNGARGAFPKNIADYRASGIPAGTGYTCAWGPHDRKPSMIRITLVLDDPGARLNDGQACEFVFKIQ